MDIKDASVASECQKRGSRTESFCEVCSRLLSYSYIHLLCKPVTDASRTQTYDEFGSIALEILHNIFLLNLKKDEIPLLLRSLWSLNEKRLSDSPFLLSVLNNRQNIVGKWNAAEE